MKTKKCAKCGVTKPITEFNRHSRSKDGLQNWCRDCMKISSYKSNERIKEGKHKKKIILEAIEEPKEDTSLKEELSKAKDEIARLKKIIGKQECNICIRNGCKLRQSRRFYD